jgi:glycosyltransferase involved in cell wall biosynthesis
MKIIHLIPGSGGTFYCQNCMRDNELITTLKKMGNEVLMVPLYLPLSAEDHMLMGDTPVFYGAINIYLKEIFPLYRHAPMWLEKLFDSPFLLKLAAKKSGSTRASGLEELTLSMLDGENGRQASELEHLIHYLKHDVKPDIVHLSNALLLGLARRLKNDLGIPVVCSLQDENEWIDPMREKYKKKVWDKMAERAAAVDGFIAASRYYADRSSAQMMIPAEKIHVVYGGIDLSLYQQAPHTFDPPVVGYLCRLSEYFGLGILVEAFLSLKKLAKYKNLKLYLMGGYTGDDKPYINKILKKISRQGILADVVIFDSFEIKERLAFLNKLSLLSVPVPGGEAFGAYQVESLASGVPIVQPRVGGYPEFIEATGGGILYEPNDPLQLAQALSSLLDDPERLREMGRTGRAAVMQNYSMKNMADQIMNVYRQVLDHKQNKATDH